MRTSERAGEVALDLLIEEPRWTRALAEPEALLERCARAALAQAGVPGPVELCVMLADDARMRALNAQWRGKDAPTNVLSFPSAAPWPPGAPRPLGDIALGFETAAAEANAFGRPFSHHVAHLIVHGTLHLIGYDHEVEAEAERMERLEAEALARLDVPNPYEGGSGP